MKYAIPAKAWSAIQALVVGASLSAPAAARSDPAHKKVAILIFDNVEVIDYSGPLEVLSDAGFDVFTVAATKRSDHHHQRRRRGEADRQIHLRRRARRPILSSSPAGASWARTAPQ